ncbi:hypothetical protein DPMN_022414 [Dreissena polymorpha]|uniref:Uncharacterized protein n=1 Tax=Dreissena polymorpha TaxID=45954 RepID=A0A9D4NNU6_DREPO|nr:hypothetical protein DPMN_022414 [Dreissena polymorpha]
MKLTVGIAPLTPLAELCPAPTGGSSGPLDPQQISISPQPEILDPPLYTVLFH